MWRIRRGKGTGQRAGRYLSRRRAAGGRCCAVRAWRFLQKRLLIWHKRRRSALRWRCMAIMLRAGVLRCLRLWRLTAGRTRTELAGANVCALNCLLPPAARADVSAAGGASSCGAAAPAEKAAGGAFLCLLRCPGGDGTGSLRARSAPLLSRLAADICRRRADLRWWFCFWRRAGVIATHACAQLALSQRYYALAYTVWPGAGGVRQTSASLLRHPLLFCRSLDAAR